MATIREAKHVELQYVDDHEVMWFEDQFGRWFAFTLPPGKTFNANPEICDDDTD